MKGSEFDMKLRSRGCLALIVWPSIASADSEGVLLRCTVETVEAHGGTFAQGVTHLENPDFRVSLTVRPDSLVYREHYAGASTPHVTQYQGAITFENGILYAQREADAQSEYGLGHQFNRNEISVPFNLDGFTSFETEWMCYENGCSLHTQRIDASCGSAIAIDGDVY